MNKWKRSEFTIIESIYIYIYKKKGKKEKKKKKKKICNILKNLISFLFFNIIFFILF